MMTVSTETPPAGWFFIASNGLGANGHGSVIAVIGDTLLCEIEGSEWTHCSFYEPHNIPHWQFFRTYEEMSEQLKRRGHA